MPSNFNLFLTPQAKKELKKIQKGNPKIAAAIAAALNQLEIDPSRGEFLHGDLKDRRKLRVGDYRVIYRMAREKLLVFILRIAHRKEVYR